MTKKEKKDLDGRSMRILVAIDGSEPSGLAVDLAAEAVETGAGLFGGPWPALALVQADQIEAAIREEAQRTVHEARDRFAQPGLKVKAVVLRGRPATAIVDRASNMHADLVIVGSRGHGPIQSMLLGSVSAEVVDHAPTDERPVLLTQQRSRSGRSSYDPGERCYTN